VEGAVEFSAAVEVIVEVVVVEFVEVEVVEEVEEGSKEQIW